MTDFLGTVQLDFHGLLGKIEQMRGNMTRLIEDRKKSESLLFDERKKQNARRENRQGGGESQNTLIG